MNEKKKRITPEQATLLYFVISFSFLVYLATIPFVENIIANICEDMLNKNLILGTITCIFFVFLYLHLGIAHVIVARMLVYEYGALETEGDP